MSEIAAQLVILEGQRFYFREKGDGLDIPGLVLIGPRGLKYDVLNSLQRRWQLEDIRTIGEGGVIVDYNTQRLWLSYWVWYAAINYDEILTPARIDLRDGTPLGISCLCQYLRVLWQGWEVEWADLPEPWGEHLPTYQQLSFKTQRFVLSSSQLQQQWSLHQAIAELADQNDSSWRVVHRSADRFDSGNEVVNAEPSSRAVLAELWASRTRGMGLY